MIRLTKRIPPEELITRLQERTERFLHLLSVGRAVPDSLASSYKDPEVKALLRAETADKCAYCESKIPHISYGDVEHIVPKSIRPETRFSYENLTYACSICNNKKSDYHDEQLPLLNPYVDEPGQHFIAAGPMVGRVPTSDRALVTEKRLELNRSGLVERRKERLESIGTLLDQLARTTQPAIRSVLEAQLTEECADDKEFAFVVRGYVAALLPLVA